LDFQRSRRDPATFGAGELREYLKYFDTSFVKDKRVPPALASESEILKQFAAKGGDTASGVSLGEGGDLAAGAGASLGTPWKNMICKEGSQAGLPASFFLLLPLNLRYYHRKKLHGAWVVFRAPPVCETASGK